MADVEETGKIVGIAYRVISVLFVIAFIVGFILGIHWLDLLPLIIIAVPLYIAASRFVVAIRTSNSTQTIFFIIISVILLILSVLCCCVLAEGLINDKVFGDTAYYIYPSPVAVLIQIFTVYVAFKVRSSILARTDGSKLNA